MDISDFRKTKFNIYAINNPELYRKTIQLGMPSDIQEFINVTK